MFLRFRFSAALFSLLLALLLGALPLLATPGEAGETGRASLYFANWNVYDAEKGEVRHLPWGKIDRIYHAFWKIIPEETGFSIVSTDSWADTDPKNPAAHFAQYAAYSARYPETEILLSIGGWTCSGYFSQMAGSEAGRASFIESCLNVLNRYSFFSGLDLDWEYPGVYRAGGADDQGNPVLGNDTENYTLLLSELRAALDQRFGKGVKRLTVCASASVSTLEKQDYAALHPYVDTINLMTYDMTDASAPQTGHHSPLYGAESADTAVRYLKDQGVPAAKIAIGTPLYSHGWKNIDLNAAPLGASAQGRNYGGTHLWHEIALLEEEAAPEGPGWHTGYDEAAEAAYLWNDDPLSPYYRSFLSYESSRSLRAKLRYILQEGLGGIIIWQSAGDDALNGWPMTKACYAALHAK